MAGALAVGAVQRAERTRRQGKAAAQDAASVGVAAAVVARAVAVHAGVAADAAEDMLRLRDSLF